MKKHVPLEKLSKKEKARIARERRVTWAFDPVSRIKENKKRDAKKRLYWEENDPMQPLLF